MRRVFGKQKIQMNNKLPFLTSGIPNLELDRLSIEFERSDFEVNTDGRDVGFRVGVVGKTKQQARLSDARVSNEQDFEEVIVFRGGHSSR